MSYRSNYDQLILLDLRNKVMCVAIPNIISRFRVFAFKKIVGLGGVVRKN